MSEDHFTTKLLDALFAAFDRCEREGQPLSATQQAWVADEMFAAFADELVDALWRPARGGRFGG